MTFEFENGKILVLKGEATLDPPMFYADKESLNYWGKPKGQRVTEEERKNIIKEINKKFKGKILFD
ncbi:Imm74 family immunity protein [Spongiimicrobium sp. 2-473A-2-J]|uniref:Imm74 family immunity protein n=1 Tax=Eudoraea algarum TaxID=3417568 RepID=UPI003D35EAE6